MTLDQATSELLATVGVTGDELLDQMNAWNGPAPKMVLVEDHAVPGVAAPVRVLVPTRRPRAVMIWYHGWSATSRPTDICPTIGRKLAERTGCAVVLADCARLPEAQPADVIGESSTILRWVAANLTSLVGRGVPILVAGQGTGANLATLVAMNSSRQGGPSIALQVLICPVTDADLDRRSYRDPENQVSLTRESLARRWAAHVPQLAERSRPDVAPLRADRAQLSSMPSTAILTAEHDPLHDEGELYADALVHAGVQVDRCCYSGQMHGFFTILQLPGSERGFQQVVKAVRACLAYESHPQPMRTTRRTAKNETFRC